MIKNIIIKGLLYLFFPLYLYPQQVDSSLFYYNKAEKSYNKFDNYSALKYYIKAYKFDSTNYDVAWKLSRTYVDVGEIKKNKNERKIFYQKGLKYAIKATEINSEGAKGYLSCSIAVGRVALDAGKKEQVKLSKEVKNYVDKSIELDPSDDIAWHVLGRWNRKMATLGWVQRKFANIFLGGLPKDASVDNAVTCFKKAIEINPNSIRHHLELGITYEKQKEKELARVEYKRALELPIQDSDDSELKKEAKKRLNDIE